jgi:hypothetical protein
MSSLFSLLQPNTSSSQQWQWTGFLQQQQQQQIFDSFLQINFSLICFYLQSHPLLTKNTTIYNFISF